MTALSLTRPKALPGVAPVGRAAREMPRDRWVDHPGYGLTPQRVVQIFRLAEMGSPQQQCDLFDDLNENDATLRNLFDQRNGAVAGKPTVIQPGGPEDDAQLAAQVMGAAMRRLPLVDTIAHQLTHVPAGYAGSEIDWGLLEFEGRRFIVPTWFANIPHRRFAIDPGSDELRLITEAQPSTGEELAPGKWLVTRRSGIRVARSGLMRTAAWLALWKRFATRDWVIYGEKYGLPLVLSKYKDSAGGTGSSDDDARLVAEEIVRNIGNDGGAVVPDSITVEFHDAGRGDSSGVHGGLIAFCNAEMSKLVNGSTLSNDNAGSGGASYALGEVHAGRAWDNAVADAERLQEAFRIHVCEPFMRFNNLVGAAPLLKIQVVRDLAPRERAEVADILVNKLGIEVSAAQLHQECGFKEPTGDNDRVAKAAPPPVAAPKPAEVAA